MIEQAGGKEAELVAETGFNSSRLTRGALLRASKLTDCEAQRQRESPMAADTYREFFDEIYADGTLDGKTKMLIALGASLAAGCDPLTQYFLAAARQRGATERELQETAEVATSVGATKIHVLQESVLASSAQVHPQEDESPHQVTLTTGQGECST